MVAINRKGKSYLFAKNASERNIINSRLKINKKPKILPEKEALFKSMSEVIKEIKQKKKVDFIDLDRILGKNGFSYTETQIVNFMKTIKNSGVINFSASKSTNPNIVYTYTLKKENKK